MTAEIVESILSRCHRTPDAPAITGATVTWTYGMLEQRVESRAEVFRHRVRPGAAIAILMVAEPDSVAHVLAAAIADRVPVLVPPRLPAWEERATLRDAGAGYLASRGMFLPLGEEGPPAQRFAGGLMQLTSGSLGPSRPAFRAWDGIGDEIRAVTESLKLSSADTLVTASSLAHSYGFMGGVLAPLSAGAHVVVAIDPSVDVAAARPSVIFGLGTSFAGWRARYPSDSFRSVRFAFSAGAPLPEGLYGDFLAHFGVPIRQDYGTTETGTVALDTADDVDPASVGIVLPHLESRLSGGSNGEGELWVRGRAVASAYVGEGRFLPCTDGDGWYHTLDMARTTPAGRLKLTGRRRPPLAGGSNGIDPAAVEAALVRMPGTREAVVLQTPTPQGAALKVVVTGDVTQAELDRWVQDKLGHLGLPIIAELRQELPRSPAGKLLQKYLI